MTRRPRGLSLALAGILGLAAVLRFAGLSWGLRHAPEGDETVFVANVAEMIRHHDLDQRFYEYPGLFFLLLRLPLSLLSPEALASSAAYLAARATVAAFGVASVFLVWVLARRLVSPRAGLIAALFLAVSPIEVSTAHMVRPDVVLETLVLLFYLVLFSQWREPLQDAMAGLALGAAVALKPTSILLLPSLVFERAMRPGRRLRGLVLAGLCAAGLAAIATPSLMVNPQGMLDGFRSQIRYHYSPVTHRSGSALWFYLGAVSQGLGPAACFLVLAGAWKAKARWRQWIPVALFPAILIGVLSTATEYSDSPDPAVPRGHLGDRGARVREPRREVASGRLGGVAGGGFGHAHDLRCSRP